MWLAWDTQANCRHSNVRRREAGQCGVCVEELLVGRSRCGGGGSAAIVKAVEAARPGVVGLEVRGSDCPAEKFLEWAGGWMADGAALTITYSSQAIHTGRRQAMPDTWHAQASSRALPSFFWTRVSSGKLSISRLGRQSAG
jgi:hypothetical protein